MRIKFMRGHCDNCYRDPFDEDQLEDDGAYAEDDE